MKQRYAYTGGCLHTALGRLYCSYLLAHRDDNDACHRSLFLECGSPRGSGYGHANLMWMAQVPLVAPDESGLQAPPGVLFLGQGCTWNLEAPST